MRLVVAYHGLVVVDKRAVIVDHGLVVIDTCTRALPGR
jgi:hypothetical protein